VKLTLGQIAQMVNGELIGDAGVIITGISGLKEAKSGDISFLANPKYGHLLDSTQASAVITSRQTVCSNRPIIRTDNPSLAFSQMVSIVAKETIRHPQGVSQSAYISPQAKLGKNIAVGQFAIVEAGAVIGDDTIIYGGVYIGYNSQIGNNCLIYSNVSIRERIIIGNRVIIHCGAVIGSDGFGFADVGAGVQEKIPQVGIVVISDDVEIGANVTIDRARFDRTVIGKGTKIDNLVQIAHNVVTGENCIIVAQAGISGSTVLGKNVILAGQVGLAGHLEIGDGCIVAAQSGVSKSLEANTKVFGYPAKPHNEAKRINAYINNLPQLHDKIKLMEKKIAELEKKLSEKNG
jgi:UDP-3-O-[3-hydroxymyristoyl] glucosamine N-acyltransferase